MRDFLTESVERLAALAKERERRRDALAPVDRARECVLDQIIQQANHVSKAEVSKDDRERLLLRLADLEVHLRALSARLDEAFDAESDALRIDSKVRLCGLLLIEAPRDLSAFMSFLGKDPNQSLAEDVALTEAESPLAPLVAESQRRRDELAPVEKEREGLLDQIIQHDNLSDEDQARLLLRLADLEVRYRALSKHAWEAMTAEWDARKATWEPARREFAVWRANHEAQPSGGEGLVGNILVWIALAVLLVLLVQQFLAHR